MDDARYALRQIKRNTGFTLAADFSLAIGIAAATTAFTITDTFLLRLLPVHDAGRLFALSTRDDAEWTLWTYASFVAWRDSQTEGLDVAATSNVLSVPMERSEGARVRVSLVSGSYFRVMGVDMALGRAFADSEGRVPMADPVVVVSDTFWTRWFGGGADITGKSISLNGTVYEIIGVTRSPFTGDHVGHPTDVWAPISMLSAALPGRQLLDDPFGIRRRWLRVLGRLHSGASLEAAEASVNLTHRRVAAERADTLGETHPQVVGSRNQVVSLRNAASGYAPERGRYALPVQVLTGITGLLLLVALTMVVGCVGLYALIAYDAAQRTHEIGIRLALGATRSSVIRMILREGGLLMMLGLACGVPLGILAMRPLYARLYGVDAFDSLTLLAATAVLSGVTLLACWKPAYGASRVDPASLLRSE